MFIGPFTVYLGGLMGPAANYVLTAATIFTLLCIFLPFVHSYILLIVATCLAGLASGTFYPLNAHVCAAQHSSPVSSVHDCSLRLVRGFCLNIAPSLYGWCRNHLFLGMDVLEFGCIRAADYAVHLLRHTQISCCKRTRRGTELCGIFVCERGFCIGFGCVRAGEKARLVALWSIYRASSPAAHSFYCALWFVACAAPILLLTCLTCGNGTRSLLGTGLFFFRFFLVTTIILVPQALAIHGFEPDQIGPAVIWTAGSFVPPSRFWLVTFCFRILNPALTARIRIRWRWRLLHF